MSEIPPPPPPSQPPQQPPGPPQQPYGGYPAPMPMPQTSNDAVIALVLSLLSWAVCPVVLAIVALVFASGAKKKIEASNGWVTGEGLVTAAKIIAWINIAVWVLGGIFFLIVMVIGIANSEITYNDAPLDFDNNALMWFGR